MKLKRGTGGLIMANKKCFKKSNGYSMYIKCEATGKEVNCDIYYWNDFNFCHYCGQALDWGE